MKYCKEITDELCKYIRAGNTAIDSCALANIGESTFYEWKEKHAEFAESIKKAEIKNKARLINIIQKRADETWQAAAWFLERRFKDEFSRIENRNIDHTHKFPDTREVYESEPERS